MSEQKKKKKKRYYEPATQDIDVANFRKVIESHRSVRKFTDKPIPSEILDECLYRFVVNIEMLNKKTTQS